jgi:hypothetical protein
LSSNKQIYGRVLKTTIFALVIAGVALWLLNLYFRGQEKQSKAEAAREQWQATIDSTRQSVRRMVQRYAAIDDWEAKLIRSGWRASLVYTVELENLWISPRPIVFVGLLSDARHGNSDTEYEIQLDRGYCSYTEHYFTTDLVLSLRSAKAVVDSVLIRLQRVAASEDPGIAAIARVERIHTEYLPDINGKSRRVLVGEGELIALSFVGGAYSELEFLQAKTQ